MAFCTLPPGSSQFTRQGPSVPDKRHEGPHPTHFCSPLPSLRLAILTPAGAMPCDIPASTFAGKPELCVEEFGTQYLLTLWPKHQPSQSAPKQALTDGDGRMTRWKALVRRSNVNPAGHEIGVMVCASDAATRRKLMTQAAEWH